MVYVCVSGVMDIVFSVCIVTRGAVGHVCGKYECFVMQILYVLCLVGILWQFSMRHAA